MHQQAYGGNFKEAKSIKLMPLIPYDASDEAIEMNYKQLVHIPYVLCRNGLRSQESDCREVYEKMSEYANKIIAERRESEPVEK